jgi:hypothetical protein
MSRTRRHISGAVQLRQCRRPTARHRSGGRFCIYSGACLVLRQLVAETSPVPVGAVGQVLKLAWAGWVRARDAREAHKAIASVLDIALRRALCPSAPDARTVRELALKIFAELQDVPPNAVPSTLIGRFGRRIRFRLPRLLRRNKLPAVASFGHETYDRLLGRWIASAVEDGKFAMDLVRLECPDGAPDARALADRFPDCFFEALEAADESKWRTALLESLKGADEQGEWLEKRRKRRTTGRATATGLVTGVTAAGAAELAGAGELQVLVIGGGSAALGLGAGWLRSLVVERRLLKGLPDPTPSADAGPLELTESDRERGVILLALLDGRPDWVNRRVEQVSIEDPNSWRRRASLDFTIPHDLPPMGHTGMGEDASPLFFVPVAMLRKDLLTRFSVWNEKGTPCTLLGRRENSRLAAAALIALAHRAVGELADREQVRAPHGIEQTIWKIVSQRQQRAKARWEDFGHPVVEPGMAPSDEDERQWREKLDKDKDFLRLANDLTRTFLLLVPVTGEPGERRVLKYSYDQRQEAELVKLPRPVDFARRLLLMALAGPRRTSGTVTLEQQRAPVAFQDRIRRLVLWWPASVKFDTPLATQGGRYHLEVDAPVGLQVTRAILQTVEPDRNLDMDLEAVSRARVYLHRSPTDDANVRALVNLRPLGETVIRAAVISSIVTTVILAVVLIWQEELLGNFGAVTTLLLTVPLALAAYTARSGETRTTSHVLFGLRALIVASGMLSLAALLFLAAGRSCSTPPPEAVRGAGDDSFTVLVQQAQVCESGSGTTAVLAVVTAASAVIMFVLLRAVIDISRPPERQRPTGFPTS